MGALFFMRGSRWRILGTGGCAGTGLLEMLSRIGKPVNLTVG
jgi:hypothetical protein